MGSTAIVEALARENSLPRAGNRNVVPRSCSYSSSTLPQLFVMNGRNKLLPHNYKIKYIRSCVLLLLFPSNALEV